MSISINGSTGISGVDGDASTPAVKGSDTNTGISFGTDIVSASTGGSERARIDSSGRLLVNTSSDFGSSTKLGVFNGSYALGSYQSNAFAYAFQFIKSRNTSTIGTIVQNGDELGNIVWYGDDGTSTAKIATAIQAYVDGTPSANDMPGRIVLSTTASGASSPTERMRITQEGRVYLVQVGTTFVTTAAANVNVDAGDGQIRRSTSSIKYKTDVETLDDSYADALLACRPVWYRSTCEGDNPGHSWWGFIAEEVAAIDPRLVHWKTVEVTYDDKGSPVTTPCDPEPEGVAYDRFVPHLLNLIKRQKEQIEAMEARLSALEGV